ncbi:MAG TPA: molybdopterin-synthase adenylyltransferase MoeB [Armatimonadetes bacterium]|nr:molybdopterin-synthase adenylyltransferase MoeB [Armatimonadota bacterium]
MSLLDYSEEWLERYSRQLILPEVGGKGQRKINEARVLIVGAGGLGSPCALYLAAAGVGTLGVVDSDAVELSNLQRQILHTTFDLNRPKALSAQETLQALNPEVEVRPYQMRLTSENALDIVADYDIVVDGSDNFPTRYLVNDACLLTGKPLVTGAILRFEAQVTTIIPGQTGCYRCLFPTPPPPGQVPSCQEAGVLGPVCGIVGSLQAGEVLKLILGRGELLANWMFLYDGFTLEFHKVRLRRDPDCPLCGEHPRITELIDYEEFCQVARETPSPWGTK